MTQIPIPTQLNDLIYMLPGADASNASAWNFLLQLAERVSVLTEITATIDFDDNMIVDISKLEVMNEYFSLTKTVFDETTNTLTLTLNWIDQTKAIDPETANPLCMLKGITPAVRFQPFFPAKLRQNMGISGCSVLRKRIRRLINFPVWRGCLNRIVSGIAAGCGIIFLK